MTDRLSTGNKQLDAILHGGLLKNAINLIVGIPGSGKTILSQQVAFQNATQERPALYLSTLSEPLDKIIRYAESLQFFHHEAIREYRTARAGWERRFGIQLSRVAEQAVAPAFDT